MSYLEIHERALVESGNEITPDAVYIGAMLFQILTKKPCRAKPPKHLNLLPVEQLAEVCKGLHGKRATASEVYKMVTGKKAGITEATNTATQMRALGYTMMRSNGKNWYHF